MNALVILLVSIVFLVCGYLFYGRWLAKEWGVDPARETPAHTLSDGLDYCPAKAPVLLGHHFASIAGAGPINGPIQAAVFGWVPVLLWILLGGVFFGATHDFAALFSSIRHEGKSIGHVIEVNIGRRGKRLFLVFAYLTLLLVVAAFGSIVVGTFKATYTDGVLDAAASIANGRTAMISMLFIVLAILFGFFVYRRNAPLGVSTVIGVAALVACIVIGYNFPVYAPETFWNFFVLAYILVASITPVWILLQPRDYLNSFLLYGMILLAIVGIFTAHPAMTLPAFTGFGGITGKSQLFPVLFITVACGAISGFHSLVGSGTTAKQLDNEKDAMAIGYGGMLIECALAVISLICVGFLFGNSAVKLAETGLPAGSPTAVFATGIATMLQTVGLPYDVMYSVLILAVSAFCLTSLDTATRLARYMLQEFFVNEGEDVKKPHRLQKIHRQPLRLHPHHRRPGRTADDRRLLQDLAAVRSRQPAAGRAGIAGLRRLAGQCGPEQQDVLLPHGLHAGRHPQLPGHHLRHQGQVPAGRVPGLYHRRGRAAGLFLRRAVHPGPGAGGGGRQDPAEQKTRRGAITRSFSFPCPRQAPPSARRCPPQGPQTRSAPPLGEGGQRIKILAAQPAAKPGRAAVLPPPGLCFGFCPAGALFLRPGGRPWELRPPAGGGTAAPARPGSPASPGP
jgi:carbon starvation protein